jgi:hypothetical protein
MKTTTPQVLALLLIAAAIGGCNAYPRLESDFGDSVRHMVRSQRLTTEPANMEPVRQTDGQRADNALGVYRSGVTTPRQSGGQNVTLDLGAAFPRQ